MWGEVVEAGPRELTPFLQLVRQGGRRIAQTYAVWANDVPADATAYAHRTQNFSLAADIRSGHEEQARRQWRKLPSSGLHLSYETHDHAAALTKAFPSATLEHLRKTRAAYDPENVFRSNFAIAPPCPPTSDDGHHGNHTASVNSTRMSELRQRESLFAAFRTANATARSYNGGWA